MLFCEVSLSNCLVKLWGILYGKGEEWLCAVKYILSKVNGVNRKR